MKKWVCTVCGYVYEGEQAPEKCPTGFRGIPGSHTLYNKGDQDYEEMGLYSLRLRL